MIPKIIHFCWFGNNKKTDLVLDCIVSWKKLLPDYEIIEWNELNTDLSNPYVKEAYESKKWAFVSDYIRLKKLYDYGGIYLDTDMLLMKNLDIFLNHECFFGSESINLISCGIIGASKNNKLIAKCISYYDNLEIDVNFNFNSVIIPNVVTDLFMLEYDFKDNFENIVELNGITIYPQDFFYPLPFNGLRQQRDYKKYLTKNSYAVHLWSSSWVEFTDFQLLQRREYLKALKIILKNDITMSYLKSIFYYFLLSFKKDN